MIAMDMSHGSHADLPLTFKPQVMECVASAAKERRVPRIILLSLIKGESNGNPKAVNLNKDGTRDWNLMQINDRWIQRLERDYGIRNAGYQIKNDSCYNVRVGAWILRHEIDRAVAKGGTIWDGIGNYHSATPKHHYRYRKAVAENMQWIFKNTNWTAY